MAQYVWSHPGEMIPQDWRRWIANLLEFTVPQFLAVLFGQLAVGQTFGKALPVALLTLYGAIRDYFNKRNEQTKYPV